LNIITGPVAARRGVALAIALAALVACALAVLPSAADASFRFELKPIKATKGYKVHITGAKSFASVNVENRKLGALVSYQPYKSKNTRKKVTIKLGQVGSAKLKFKKKGKAKEVALPKGCSGKPGKQQPGVFTGKIDLKGEEGFFKLKVGSGKKLAGKLILKEPTIKKCKPGKSTPDPDYASLTLFNSFDVGSDNWVQGALFASRPDTPDGKTEIFASTIEDLPKYWAFRSVSARNRPTSALQYTKPFTTATVTPGVAPFRGSATINQESAAVPTGDLEVDFPGRPGFSFTQGPDRHGMFYIQSSNVTYESVLRDPAAAAAKLRDAVKAG